jgi:diguanylate cyclase (GGDEF)-like protein
MLAEATQHAEPVTLAIVDLDRFKSYNDTHGHLAGDELLRGFAHDLARALRRQDFAARWGGEEFAVALPGCDGEQARRVLDRVLAAVPGTETCSVGSAVWLPGSDLTRVISAADAALYEAKRTGRARLVQHAEVA